MKNIYTILIFLLSIHLGYSQQKPEKYSLNSMADFSDFPVGNANGNPEIVVPLNKIKTQGNLDVNLMLQYNLYGSINAEMMGGQFGDAWNLTLSGVVTRETRAKNSPASMAYLLFDERFFSSPSNNNRIDGDVYTFNVLGLQGKFYLKRENSIIKAYLIESNDFVNIEVSYNSEQENFISFEITDKAGNKYLLAQKSNLNMNRYYVSKLNPNPQNPSTGVGIFDPNKPDDTYIVEERQGPAFYQHWLLTQVKDKYNQVLFSMTYDQVNFFMSETHYIKEIQIPNVGAVFFSNTIASTGARDLSNSYAKEMIIKDLKGNIISQTGFNFDRKAYFWSNQAYTESFVKTYLKKITTYDKNKANGLHKEFFYKGEQSGSAAKLGPNGFLTPKNCFHTYAEYKNVKTHLTIQKIKHSTGGAILYEFEPNTYSWASEMTNMDNIATYKEANYFNIIGTNITPVYNTATASYTFNVATGTDFLHAAYKGAPYSLYLYHNNVSVGNVIKVTGDLSEVCSTSSSRYNVQNRFGQYEIKNLSGSTPSFFIRALKYKPDTKIEKFLYADGVRIKRTAYFENDPSSNYLEENLTATQAEREITYQYKDISDSKKSSGRHNITQYIAGIDRVKGYVLYERVKVSVTGNGSMDYYYDNVSLNDALWRFKNQKLRKVIAFDNAGNRLKETEISRSFEFLPDDISGHGFVVEPIVVKEASMSKEFENGQAAEQQLTTYFDIVHRNVTESSRYFPSTNETFVQSQFYNKINNSYVVLNTTDYYNNEKMNEVINTYNPQGDVMYSSVSKGNLVPQQRGVRNTRVVQGRVEEYLTADGTYVSQIWGYNNTRIVAELKNVRYQTIPIQVVSGIKNYSSAATYNETALTTMYSNLRNYFSTLAVTTYVYEPLVGIKSIIDTNGRTETYQYDAFNRLYRIINHEGLVTQQFNYNYKNQ